MSDSPNTLVTLPLLPFLNTFQYDVTVINDVLHIYTVSPPYFPASPTTLQALDIPSITLEMDSNNKGVYSTHNASSVPVTHLYLLYNNQTTYYDFLGTNVDSLSNFDV